MKQEQVYIDLAAIDISIEDFDAFHEKHEFSQKYQEDKLRMLKEYRKNIGQTTKRNVLKVAAAAVVLFISAPVLANAASDGAFLTDYGEHWERKTLRLMMKLCMMRKKTPLV